MRGWLKRNPWVWIVALFLAVVVVNAALVVIAERNAPAVAH